MQYYVTKYVTVILYIFVRFSQEQYSKKTMPKNNDHIIKPFTLTVHEKSLPIRLTDIALSKSHSRIALANDVLIPVLALETLKKKTMYDTKFQQNVASPNKKVAPQSKGGEKRRRKSQNTSYPDDADGDIFQKKRARGGGGGGGGADRSSRKQDVIGSGGGDVGGVRSIPLEVLQPQLEAVFQVFWDLELDPPALATPFFGLITRNNCDVLGLPRFFDKILTESCSLANISVSSSQ